MRRFLSWLNEDVAVPRGLIALLLLVLLYHLVVDAIEFLS